MSLSILLVAHDEIAAMRWCGLHAVGNESGCDSLEVHICLKQPSNGRYEVAFGSYGAGSERRTSIIYSSAVPTTTYTREHVQSMLATKLLLKTRKLCFPHQPNPAKTSILRSQ